MARYEQKRTELNDLADEVFKKSLRIDDEDEGFAMFRAAQFVQFILKQIDSKKTGANIGYSSGTYFKGDTGVGAVRIEGAGPDILFGLMELIAAVVNRLDPDGENELLSDLFNGANILIAHKKKEGEEA